MLGSERLGVLLDLALLALDRLVDDVAQLLDRVLLALLLLLCLIGLCHRLNPPRSARG